MATKTARTALPAVLAPFIFAGVKHDPSVVESIDRSRIFADKKWNVRSERAPDTTSEKGNEDEKKGWINLVCSLATSDQRDPVTVRPNPDHGKKKGLEGREFLLVSGFQRYEALEGIHNGDDETREILVDPKQGGMTPAEVGSLKGTKPTIRAFVKNLNEEEARIENIAENQQHNSLSSQDVVYGVHRLLQANPAMSSVKMAVILNSGQPFVAKLARIAKACGPAVIPAGRLHNGPETTVLDAWRKAPRRLTQAQMDAIARKEKPEEVVAAYLAAVKTDVVPGEAGGEESGEGASLTPQAQPGKDAVTNACNDDAVRIGIMLAALEKLGVISITKRIEGEEAVRACLTATKRKLKDGTTSADFGRVADAIATAMVNAKKPPKAPKAPKAANGKGASAAS